MQRWLLLFLILGGTFLGNQGLLAQVSARKYTKQFLQVYSPKHAAMIERYYKTNSVVDLPSATINIGRHIDFMAYLPDTNHRNILIHDIPLMIYDMYQGYSHRGAYGYLEKNPDSYEVGKEYMIYYFDENTEVLVSLSAMFPSIEIVKVIPTTLKEIKFKEFIATKDKEMNTQKNGFYGLLDTWNAFYHQTLMAFETKAFYERESFQEAKHWEGFFSNYYDAHYAYVEFKYFILKYLQYAKYKHPKIFQKILLDESLKKVYQEIDGRYKNVNERFQEYKPIIMKFLRDKNIAISEEKYHQNIILFIEGTGIETHSHLYKGYEKALLDEELMTIDFQMKN